MESLRNEEAQTLDPRIEYAVSHHLAAERHANTRRALLLLAKQPGQPVTSQELRTVVVGAQDTLTNQVMQRLIALTQKYGDELGFRIKKLLGACRSKGNAYVLMLDSTPFAPKKRVLTTVSSLEQEIPITDKMRRLVSRMSGGVSLASVPPDEGTVLSMVHNARLLRAETQDIDYVMMLVAAARRRMALHTYELRRALDIESTNSRYNGNIQVCSQKAALELGFVMASVQARYQAIFFLDEEEREEKIYEQTGDIESPCLDRVIPFDKVTLEKRLEQVKQEELNVDQRSVVRIIADRQKRGKPVRFKELTSMGITDRFCDSLRGLTLENRHEWGFYIRFRGDDALQCMLLERV